MIWYNCNLCLQKRKQDEESQQKEQEQVKQEEKDEKEEGFVAAEMDTADDLPNQQEQKTRCKRPREDNGNAKDIQPPSPKRANLRLDTSDIANIIGNELGPVALDVLRHFIQGMYACICFNLMVNCN